ncbi:MAG TPA: PQQ-dependent sugar dehydrogenase [Thermoleophilaceae bacterium]|nr:PQQ-dependent sugar dehydrogenase [Thermoleophilaceae bacterium]
MIATSLSSAARRGAAGLAALLALLVPSAAHAQAGVSYLVPADNPFVDRAGAAPEIFAYGLRNPYRFSFDRANGDLLLGDVGGSGREEINWTTLAGTRGANFGWPCREGKIAGPVGDADDRCPAVGAVDPLFDYPTSGSAVIGGYVVRDPDLTGLVGRYLYADYYDGDVRSLALNLAAPGDATTGLTIGTGLGSFGQDTTGRLYVVDQSPGTVARLTGGASPGTLATTPVAGTYTTPTHVAFPPGDPTRLFVVEQPGSIRLVRNGTPLATPFLDIADLVLDGGERGLLSMAFPPNYGTSGRFYVYFTDNAGDIRIEEFRRSSNPDVADPSTRRLVLSIEHSSESNHNGGQLQFGPDGYLYAGTGDGGGQDDRHRNSQNLGSRLGKLLRIDPDMVPGGGPLPPARDITPPGLRTRVPARQRVLRLGGVVAYGRCAENCALAAGALLRIRERSYRLRSLRVPAGADRRRRVKVLLTRRARRALRRALRRGRKPVLRVGVRAQDGAGNRSRLVHRRVRVRR